MRKLLFIATVCIAFLFVHQALSAEAPEQTEEQVEPTPEPSEPTPEIFLPTEEISEDFAVPFPVDI